MNRFQWAGVVASAAVAVLAAFVVAGETTPAPQDPAPETAPETATAQTQDAAPGTIRPEPRPTDPAAAPQATAAAPAAEPPEAEPGAEANPDEPECKPGVGCVSGLPLPRYVSLKGSEGNARRGPGLTHRIDWVFKVSGMPLRVTAEHEHWRRVEDADGEGGWVHYSLLSGVRSILITEDMAEFHDKPDAASAVAFQAEIGVIGRLLECQPDWCRASVEGERGWVAKTAIWGVEPGEIVE